MFPQKVIPTLQNFTRQRPSRRRRHSKLCPSLPSPHSLLSRLRSEVSLTLTHLPPPKSPSPPLLLPLRCSPPPPPRSRAPSATASAGAATASTSSASSDATKTTTTTTTSALLVDEKLLGSTQIQTLTFNQISYRAIQQLCFVGSDS